jgi:hypothetical protein
VVEDFLRRFSPILPPDRQPFYTLISCPDFGEHYSFSSSRTDIP